jgi:protein MpaA
LIFNELPSGTSIQGNEIKAYKTQGKANQYLYLIGGTHGDEVEGVYVLTQLFEWLKSEHETKDLPMVVLPILNPDGYESGNRVNAHGVDLNRNYPADNWVSDYKKDKYNPGPNALSEPENIYLDKLFNQFKPGFILSFHSWKRIVNYNGDSQDIAIEISNKNSYIISEDIGYPTPGSLGTYIPEKFDNCGIITFECPVFDNDLSLKDIWKENEVALKRLFSEEILHKKLSI